MEDLKKYPFRYFRQRSQVFTSYFEENLTGFESRMDAVRTEIAISGTYRHTLEELTFGTRVAWRNNNECIGRLFWNTLEVF
ncbi:MAG: nitric oxide synthase oxygenase [Saprospiraceae bacterium]